MQTPSSTRAPLFSATAKYRMHRAPEPTPTEDPTPGHVPVPGNDPVPHENPSQIPNGEPPPAQLHI